MRLVAEKIAAERDQLENGLISISEVLAYLSQDRYLNLAQTSDYLSISTRTLRGLLGEVPHFRLGKKMLLFKRSELDKWMLQYREGGDSELDELVDSTLAGVLGD